MSVKSGALLVSLGLLGSLCAPAAARDLVVAATAGVWLWDESTFAGFGIPETTQPVLGLRVGYVPGEALSFEGVFLTGTIDLESAAGGLSARATQVEGSLLVHFRSLVPLPAYPFIAAGAGLVHHGGEVQDVVGESFTASRLGFHLGAGIRSEFGESWAARLQVRDTFFSVEQSAADEAEITVDRVEVSLGLEALFDLGGGAESGSARVSARLKPACRGVQPVRFHPLHRLTAALLGIVLLLESGCAGGMKTLTREDLRDPKPARSYRVSLVSGEVLTFISLGLEGEYLAGTIRSTKATVEGEGEEARSTVTNVYEERRIPWSEVALVEAEEGRKEGQTWLLALGAVAAGVVVFLILADSGDDPAADDGGGKPLP